MIVSVASAGRFHADDLARQMQRLGHLGQLYTGVPGGRLAGELPPARIRSFPWLTGARWAVGRLGLHGLAQRLDWPSIQLFDRWVARCLSPCDVFNCLSGLGLYARRAARARYGALTVCDRGSPHILFTDRLLREEYGRHGVPYAGPSPRLVQKELQEYAEADLIQIPSTFAYRSFLAQGVAEAKLRLLSYGVELELFHPTPKQDDTFRAIYVGRMSLLKGIPYLLQALASLPVPNFELMLVGAMTDEVKPFFARYTDGFRYLGTLPRAELYRYYSQASVFVFASTLDGFGHVMAQAMACGLPVIATTNTGARDLFTDGVEGFIVPIREPAEMREKVLYLYEHPEVRGQMAQAALQRVNSLGGWGTFGEKALRVYTDACIAQKGRSSHVR